MRESAATASGERQPPVRLAEETWADLRARLRAFLARRISDPADVDDLVQDVMLRLYTHMGRLRDEDRLDAWAYQVARNAIVDYWRDRAARRESPLEPALGELLAAPAEPEDDEERERLRREVAACLAPMVERLAEPYREAIRLTDLGGRTQAEVAAQAGLTVPGMKARVQRGRAQLREMLGACCQIELDRRGQITELVDGREGCGTAGEGTSESSCACS